MPERSNRLLPFHRHLPLRLRRATQFNRMPNRFPFSFLEAVEENKKPGQDSCPGFFIGFSDGSDGTISP
jgi:hypothetical protein